LRATLNYIYGAKIEKAAMISSVFGKSRLFNFLLVWVWIMMFVI